MTIRKKKGNKEAIKPYERKAEVTTKRSYDLWSDFDRMFEDFRTGFDNLFWPIRQRHPLDTYKENRTPPLDVADRGDHYEIQVEVPGVPKEDINIEVTSNGVEISAEHENIQEEKEQGWLRRERSSVSFYRNLELPEELKSEEVEAELKDGILKLSLPKVAPKPEYKSTKVKIK
jgi:HSP20 family protein